MILEKTDITSSKFIYEKMELYFPYEERRSLSHHTECFEHREFEAYLLKEDGEAVGFIDLWSFEKFVFLEYFAVDSGKRNGGYGTKALCELKKLAGKRKIILEAEEPENELATRRIGFYERNGFNVNAYPYEQPSFHGENSVPLKILSFPLPLSRDEFDEFLLETRRTAYKKYV